MELRNILGRSVYLGPGSSKMDVINEVVKKPGQDKAFYVLDIREVVETVKLWRQLLPRVDIFYVKCNNEPVVLGLLTALGTGFDCASQSEMEQVLELGAQSSRIICANPYKLPSHLRLAQARHVSLMTFDSETELHKIKANYPEAQLVLRIRYDAAISQISFGEKFGVLPEKARTLLVAARALTLSVVGVAFHVGSECNDPPVFYHAIAAARKVFDEAEEEGFKPYLLDIGGGFPGDDERLMKELSHYINIALDHFFPDDGRVKIIGEPGRYIVASSSTLVTGIIGKRRKDEQEHSTSSEMNHVEEWHNSSSLEKENKVKNHEQAIPNMYYINDGVFTSFSSVLRNVEPITPTPLVERPGQPLVVSTLWGWSCTSTDCVMKDVLLPDLSLGDWLVWSRRGAYSLCYFSSFNGLPLPEVYILATPDTVKYLKAYENELDGNSTSY
ncbi:hypothetical protein OTU49_006516 [Cherax quadricarinatus]|uniref:Orn/DAP/Arg decarboxylase 2 N-terminal domain-containing protein n=1 Tax=Cherax quadricarinatus TaxID=27406 RepID=A0AAW0YLZ6_CHEQU